MIKSKYFIYLSIIIVFFLVDRISKIYVINIAETYGKVDIYLNQFVNIILVWNTGIGFGLLSLSNVFFYNVITFLIFLIIIYIVYMFKKLSRIVLPTFVSILSG